MKYENGTIVRIIGYQEDVPDMESYLGTEQPCHFYISTSTHEWYTISNCPYIWRDDQLEPVHVKDIFIFESEITEIYSK